MMAVSGRALFRQYVTGWQPHCRMWTQPNYQLFEDYYIETNRFLEQMKAYSTAVRQGEKAATAPA